MWRKVAPGRKVTCLPELPWRMSQLTFHHLITKRGEPVQKRDPAQPGQLFVMIVGSPSDRGQLFSMYKNFGSPSRVNLSITRQSEHVGALLVRSGKAVVGCSWRFAVSFQYNLKKKMSLRVAFRYSQTPLYGNLIITGSFLCSWGKKALSFP